METNITVHLVAIVSGMLTIFFAIWFMIVFKDRSQLENDLARLNEEIAFRRGSWEDKQRILRNSFFSRTPYATRHQLIQFLTKQYGYHKRGGYKAIEKLLVLGMINKQNFEGTDYYTYR